jgi:hypothetical protein
MGNWVDGIRTRPVREPVVTGGPTWVGIGLFVVLFIAVLALFVTDAKRDCQDVNRYWLRGCSAPVRIVR